MRKKTLWYDTIKRTEEHTRVAATIETDFTQVYDVFCEISKNIHSGTSFKLLFWLLTKMGDKGSVMLDKTTYKEFDTFLREDCDNVDRKRCGVARVTFDKCVSELKGSGAITSYSRGHYRMNPYVFWDKAPKERELFILEDYEDKARMNYNPDHDTKLLPG